MIYPFKGKYEISQGFGANPQDYIQFGIQGHNGIDFKLPDHTQVLSPINGRITEIGYDATGYGQYVKIENDQEGHLLAHLFRVDVGINQIIYAGDPVGLSGGALGEMGAGNSTGPHLHWGYFSKPRNRDNGYSGYVDQSQLISSLPSTKEQVDWCSAAIQTLINSVEVGLRVNPDEFKIQMSDNKQKLLQIISQL